MIPSHSIGARTLLNNCNHSTTAIFSRSAILRPILTVNQSDEPDTGLYEHLDQK